MPEEQNADRVAICGPRTTICEGVGRFEQRIKYHSQGFDEDLDRSTGNSDRPRGFAVWTVLKTCYA